MEGSQGYAGMMFSGLFSRAFVACFFFFFKHFRTTDPGGKPFSGLGPPTSIKKMAPPDLPTINLMEAFSQGFPLPRRLTSVIMMKNKNNKKTLSSTSAG